MKQLTEAHRAPVEGPGWRARSVSLESELELLKPLLYSLRMVK